MYISVDVLLLLWGAILKVNLTIQIEPRHWIQDKWEAIPSKNIREGSLRFSDKLLILNLVCLISMRFCHFMNHIRTALSEQPSMVLILSGKRELVTLPFSSYIYIYLCGLFFLLLLGAIGWLRFVMALALWPSLLII